MESINELIGKKFRRNVYGLSIWEDTIKEIVFRRSFLSIYKGKENDLTISPTKALINILTARKEGQKIAYIPHIMIRGYLSDTLYELNEIVFYD